MNRLKLWLYVLLLLGAGAGNLYFLTGWLTARSVAHIDRELRSAAAVADARLRVVAESVSAVADAAAHSPRVVDAFVDPGSTPLAPAEETVASAAQALKADVPSGALVAVAGTQGIVARAGGPNGKTISAPEPLLADAQAGMRAQAWVRLDGTLWMVAAAPVGRGGAIAVGVPVDDAFLQALRTTTGVEFTSVVDGKVAASTLAAAEASAVAGTQGSNARRPVDVGRLGRVKAALDWPVPAMRIFFADPPAARALALPVDGAGPAALVLSQATAPFFSGLAAYQLLALVAMGLFLLVGVLLGLFMSEEKENVGLPRELVSAADRIGRGEFSARAPALAGSAGVIASALNRAAEAAQLVARVAPAAESATSMSGPTFTPATAPAAAPPTAPAEAAREEEAPASGEAAAPSSEPAALSDEPAAVTQPIFAESSEGEAVVSEPAAPPAPELPAAVEAPETAAAFEAPERGGFAEPLAGPGELQDVERREPDFAPAAEPQAAPEEAPRAPEPSVAAGEAVEGNEPVLVPPAEAPLADEDERHWRSVFDDFVRLRGLTGEPDKVTYERFRDRLERNRQQLKDKHGARTVRFQPYVKDGKVALRATPVK